MRAVLDTSVLIATDVPELEGELAISTASLAELHFGVLVTTDATVRAGDLLFVPPRAVNFDPTVFDDPTVFEPHREHAARAMSRPAIRARGRGSAPFLAGRRR